MVLDPRLVVALDLDDYEAADALVRQFDPALCRLKVGKELFTRVGPACIEQWQGRGFEIFLDLKYHDIPHTVAAACRVAADLGVWMVNVHALGGRRMLEAAREAIGEGSERPLLIAVTVLTSMEDADLSELGLDVSTTDLALRLAEVSRDAGCDGVVCAATEAGPMRSRFGERFVLVTPGMRPRGSSADDQRRIVTPAEAMRAGADYLVIGRPVTAAADPAGVLRDLAAEIGELSGT